MKTDGPLDRTTSIPLALFGALTGACLIYACWHRGIWLDEFWSIRIARFDASFPRIFLDRWLGEANPPLSNLLYLIATNVGIESIELRRILLNGTALGFMILGLFGIGKDGRDANPDHGFVLLLFALVVSQQSWALGTSELRTYGWIIASLVITVAYVRRVFIAPASITRTSWLTGSLAIVLAIGLHYVTGLIASVFLGLSLVALAAARRYRDALILGIPCIIGWASTAVFGAIFILRSRKTLDYLFIVDTPWIGFGLILVVPVLTLLANPAAAVTAIRQIHRPSLPFSFDTVVVASCATVPLLLLALNQVTPILVERYLTGWQIFICAAVAAGVSRIWPLRPLMFTAIIGFAALMLIFNTAQAARNLGWNDGRDQIATIVRQCPATQVYAMSPWRLRKGRDTHVAATETALITDSYRKLGRAAGYAVTTLDLKTPTKLAVGPSCPTIVWVEHLDRDYVSDAAYVQRVGMIVIPHSSHVRLQPTASGFLMIAEPGQKRSDTPK